MPETYNISELKTRLEKLTGKEVHLYDKDELYYETDIDNDKLEEITRKAFEETLNRQAVKTVYLLYVKSFIKNLGHIKNKQQVDELVGKNHNKIMDYYNKLVIEKELFL